jgi:DNA repair exonuclease SbcCD ATPase subunit
MNRQSPPIQKQTENHSKIARNAEEISRLHSRIKETLRRRAQSDSARQQWKEACAEFHARYDLLAFPGGLNEETFFDQLGKSDPVITEWALCFLELRPYFFRSGYVWQKLLRR